MFVIVDGLFLFVLFVFLGCWFSVVGLLLLSSAAVAFADYGLAEVLPARIGGCGRPL